MYSVGLGHQQVLLEKPSEYLPDITSPSSCLFIQPFTMKMLIKVLRIFGSKKSRGTHCPHCTHCIPSGQIIAFLLSWPPPAPPSFYSLVDSSPALPSCSPPRSSPSLMVCPPHVELFLGKIQNKSTIPSLPLKT